MRGGDETSEEGGSGKNGEGDDDGCLPRNPFYQGGGRWGKKGGSNPGSSLSKPNCDGFLLTERRGRLPTGPRKTALEIDTHLVIRKIGYKTK